MTIEAKKNVQGAKGIKFVGLKTSPTKPTPEQLKLINQFTRSEYTADDFYIGQLRLANNCIDRDGERFSEEVLQRYAATAVRKTMLFDHARSVREGAAGKFFDVTIEKMSLQQAKMETGEDLQLPAGATEVWFLSPWFYVPVKGVDEKVIVNIDTGIYDWASIGFRAESCIPIMDAKGEEVLFWEYRGTGLETEMTEGSLVYLGAQYGMSVKNAGARGKGQGASEDEEGTKVPVAFISCPMADANRAWDATAAKGRLAKWASKDGSGNKDTIDWAKYQKGFGWFDHSQMGDFGGYKLPHHDVVGGELVVVWKGCSSAMAALMGSRGGVNLPDAEWNAVYDHLANHYKQFKQDPPAKAAGSDDIPGEGKTAGETAVNPHKGGQTMKDLLAKLKAKFGKTFSEDGAFEELVAFVEEKAAAAVSAAEVAFKAKIAELEPFKAKVAEFETQVAGLIPLANDGKAYRDGLVIDYVSAKANLEEIGTTPELQAPVKTMAAGFPIEFLKSEVAHLKKRVAEKFPDESQIQNREDASKRDNSKTVGGEKNPLEPEA